MKRELNRAFQFYNDEFERKLGERSYSENLNASEFGSRDNVQEKEREVTSLRNDDGKYDQLLAEFTHIRRELECLKKSERKKESNEESKCSRNETGKSVDVGKPCKCSYESKYMRVKKKYSNLIRSFRKIFL